MTDRTPTEATWLLKQGATPEQALERIAQRIAVWRDSDPDEDESWESYYSAAFDMLSAEVDDIISAVSKPIAASPPAPAGAPLTFTYRNWRGEVSERHVRIIGIRFGSSEWHPEPQLLLRAFDLDKGEEREFAVNDIGPHPLDAAAIRAEALEEHIRLLNTEAKRLLDEAEAMPTGFEQDSRGVAMILEARALDEAADALRRLADKGEAE